MLASAVIRRAQVRLSTQEIDFLATSSNNLFSPTTPGRYFMATAVRWEVTQINGTLTTGPTTNIGNNVAKNNIIASGVQPVAGDFNTSNTNGAPTNSTSTGPRLGQTLIDAGTPFKLDVTAAAVANTATICKGRVFLLGFWVSV